MSESFNIEIISPEKKLLSNKVNSVTIPSFEGEMTILSNHIPLITFLRPGIVKINDSKEEQYFLEEGTVEFFSNNLTILSSIDGQYLGPIPEIFPEYIADKCVLSEMILWVCLLVLVI